MLVFILLRLFSFSCSELFVVDKQAVDEFSREILECYGMASLSVTIVNQKEVLFQGSYGYHDRENKILLTQDSLFAIGSLTKAFTSMLLAIYSEKNIMSLEETLANQFSKRNLKFPSVDSSGKWNTIDFLSHRSGLNPYMALSGMKGQVHDRAQISQNISFFDEVEPYRNSFVYNNWMYALSAHFAEVLSGEVYEEQVKKEIFKELGMSAIFTNDKWIRHNLYRIAKAYFYQCGKNKLVPVDKDLLSLVDAMTPAGGILASSKDIAKWMMFLLNDGKTKNGKRLISSKTLHSLFENKNRHYHRTKAYKVNGEDKGYGCGWILGSSRDKNMASHTGDFFGTHRSDLTLYREENVGVFIAYSGGMKRNSWHIYDVLDAYLVDVALGLKPSLNYTTGCRSSLDGDSFAMDVSTDAYNPLTYTDILGEYHHPFIGKMQITGTRSSPIIRIKDLKGRLYKHIISEKYKFWVSNVPWLPSNLQNGVDNQCELIVHRDEQKKVISADVYLLGDIFPSNMKKV